MKRVYKYPTSSTSISFKTAFYIVVGIHVLGGLTYYAVSHNNEIDRKREQKPVAYVAGPVSDALNKNWPKKSDTPKRTVTLPSKPIAPQPKRVIVTQLQPQPTEYALAPGDNFYTVSKKLGVSFNELAKYNNIIDVRTLKVGQIIKVPQKS